MNKVIVGDCIDEMKILPEGSVDAVVTDPPYGLGFMGKGWDIHTPLDFERFTEAWATECLRVLKPGGHLLAFGGSRTWHRLAAGIEDAGFELRDSIAWLYGSGFPKSMDVSKAIDKVAGAVAAREWEGWGTALKPAFEPIVVARKPLGEKTVAANVLKYGTGALNIDATRIGSESRTNPAAGNKPGGASLNMSLAGMPSGVAPTEAIGRWPANVVLDESQAEVLDVLTDGASRFFYVAKAPKSERPIVDGVAHPTVKPLALMRWLIRLVTPPGGMVLDPFAGSGTTIEAAIMDGFDVTGIENEVSYIPLINARIARSMHGAG